MKILFATSSLFLFGMNAFAASCPDISGTYFLNAASISKVGTVSPANLSSGSCQYQGDGDSPALVGGSIQIGDMSPAYFPNGIKIYVYPASSDHCQYVSLMSTPAQGQTPYLDTVSYADMGAKLPPNLRAILTGSYNGDWDSYNKNTALLSLGLGEGGLSMVNPQENSDGSVDVALGSSTNVPSDDNGTDGLHVNDSYQSSVVIRKNGDILTQSMSKTNGRVFWVIPVNSTDATACVLQKKS